ncbi:hypothetical protein [Cellulosimicrobium cellulans]|uniref:hypothetical protein n=1 Tax=Cellulosimicrobium cellulans TaxID=1710 RepID=UPI0016529581|nr:hypothetical protein [Cellulosimicrobium cellulans]
MDVALVLDTLVRALPPGATASWLTPDGSGAPGVAAPEPGVAALVGALTATVSRHGGDLAGDASSLLVESPARTLLAHRLGGHGTLVVAAGADLNLALVRRLVRTALADGEPHRAGAGPVRRAADEPAADGPAADGSGDDAAPADGPAPALPRREPAPRVTDFRYEPEDVEVLRQLREALTG